MQTRWREGEDFVDTTSKASTGHILFHTLLDEVTLQRGGWWEGSLIGDQWVPHFRAIPDGQLWGRK